MHTRPGNPDLAAAINQIPCVEVPSQNWLLNELIPIDVVRDLLGIARALYCTGKSDGADEAELATTKKAGEALALALKLSAAGPNTIGCQASWSWADQGLRHLCQALETAGAPRQPIPIESRIAPTRARRQRKPARAPRVATGWSRRLLVDSAAEACKGSPAAPASASPRAPTARSGACPTPTLDERSGPDHGKETNPRGRHVVAHPEAVLHVQLSAWVAVTVPEPSKSQLET